LLKFLGERYLFPRAALATACTLTFPQNHRGCTRAGEAFGGAFIVRENLSDAIAIYIRLGA